MLTCFLCLALTCSLPDYCQRMMACCVYQLTPWVYCITPAIIVDQYTASSEALRLQCRASSGLSLPCKFSLLNRSLHVLKTATPSHSHRINILLISTAQVMSSDEHVFIGLSIGRLYKNLARTKSRLFPLVARAWIIHTSDSQLTLQREINKSSELGAFYRG